MVLKGVNKVKSYCLAQVAEDIEKQKPVKIDILVNKLYELFCKVFLKLFHPFILMIDYIGSRDECLMFLRGIHS